MATRSLSAGDLRIAIERRDVLPYFQPIVDLRSGRLWGFEILARWRHPKLGILSPDQFIPLAESSGLIQPLFEAVLEQACGLFSLNFPKHLTLSINVTPVQMHDKSISNYICSATRCAGFSLDRLVLEITETALLEDSEVAIAVANDLKAHGARLAIDDFGTGYSSLQHLSSLPLDEIKIDQNFVHSMNETRESRKIAAAIAGLGQSLGLTTVAEGIESTTQADMLFYMGCELGQGFLYSRPVAADELPAMIAKNVLAAPPTSSLLASEMAANLEVAPALRLAQLQAIYDGVPIGLCFVDRNLRYVSVNKRLAELIPARFGPRLGKTIPEASPIIFTDIEPYLRRALAGEIVYDVEVAAERPNCPSELNTISLSFHPVRDEANEVVGVSIAARDITDHREMEQALVEHKDRYERTINMFGSHYPYTADPDGHLTWSGGQGLSLKMVETLGDGWGRMVHPDDLAAVATRWAACVRAGEPFDEEFRVRVEDGTWHWMRSRATPRRGENGEVLRWHGLLEDIDDLKRAKGDGSRDDG
jgi:PAS domain S-box-containing protein